MRHKYYYILIFSFLIITGFLTSSFYENHADKEPVEVENLIAEVDDAGGIITPAAKKFSIKKAQKKRKVHQTVAMKLYEKEDSDAFIARIDKEIEEAQYEAENNDVDFYEVDQYLEELELHREEVENILASHQAMRLAFHENQEESYPDRFIEEEYVYEEQ